MGFLNIFKRKKEQKSQEENLSSDDYKVVALLHSYEMEEEYLGVKEISNLAEAIQSYISNLLKDLESMPKEGSVQLKNLDASITKIKKIVEDLLELNNQLDQLIKYYHEPVLNILNKVNEIKKRSEVEKAIEVISTQKQNITKLCDSMKEFMPYGTIFNQENSSVEEISKQFEDIITNQKLPDEFKELKKQIATTLFGKHNLEAEVNPEILKNIHKMLYE